MQGTEGIQSSPGTNAQRSGAAVERDVEAPGVFSERDNGLWDGRPSLGGVSVAHPDVDAPERVIIRNTESGRETIGALFKRERMNPGPVFQVSAEAASAVGMLAGAPTALEVVALRTEEVQAAPEPAPAPEADSEAEVAEGAAPAPQTAPEPEPQPAPQTDADAPEGSAPADTLIAVPEDEEPPKRGFFARLFGRNTPAEDEITTVPLDAMAPQTPAEPAAPGAPPPMPTPLAGNTAPAPAASQLDRAFIQIGIFSVESNATGAARSMRNAGLSASVKPGSTQGNAFWRVVVGPAASASERREMLAQVKKLGFADAYAVRR